METLLRFNDLASLDQTTMGVGSAGLAVFARAGFVTVRGFVITPTVLSDFLKKDGIASALADFKGSEPSGDARERLRAVFLEERILWSHEMDLLTGFRELDGAVTLVNTTGKGTGAVVVYASNETTFLRAIKECWLRWVFSDAWRLESENPPALLVRKILDAETSVELRSRKSGIQVRAVYGLPEGLDDSSVTSDIYEFDLTGELSRMEQRSQGWQYVLGKLGPVKVEVDADFREEEKASGEDLMALEDIMEMLVTAKKVARCLVCFVAGKPVIYSGDLIPETKDMSMTLPHRESSLTLMSVSDEKVSRDVHIPVIGTKLYLKVDEGGDINRLGNLHVDGLMFTKDFTSDRGWPKRLLETAGEAKRRLNSSRIAVEIPDDELNELVEFSRDAQGLVGAGIELSLLLPGTRSIEEMKNAVNLVKRYWKGPKVKHWLPVRYPSNLFFMEELADNSDMFALDLDTFARLMLGATDEDDDWVDYSLSVLRSAYSEMFMGASALDKNLAVLSPDLVGAPSLLEFLVREGAEILCVRAEEFSTVKHIVASIEKRLLLERSRS